MMMDFPVTAEFARSANAVQLHDEARGQKTNWPASFVEREDGTWAYRVDRDDVDRDAVQAALEAHTPVFPPDPEDEFRAAIEAATDVTTLKAALLGTDGPGAEPRRPDQAAV